MIRRRRSNRVPLVGRVLEVWLEEYGHTIRPASLKRAQQFVARDLSFFRLHPVTRVTDATLWTYVREQVELRGKSPRTVKVGLAWMRRALNLVWKRKLEAIPWCPPPDLIPPDEDIKLAMRNCIKHYAHVLKEPASLTREDCELLMAVAREKEPAWAPFIQLALATGMRRSELRALHWECVNLDSGWVQIRYNFSGETLGSAKAPRGHTHRKVHLPPAAVAMLRELHARRRPDCPYVFEIDGQHIRDSVVGHAIDRVFDEAERRGMPPERSLHSARRWYVSEGRQHMSDAWMQNQVGHSAAVQQTYDRTEKVTMPPGLEWADF